MINKQTEEILKENRKTHINSNSPHGLSTFIDTTPFHHGHTTFLNTWSWVFNLEVSPHPWSGHLHTVSRVSRTHGDVTHGPMGDPEGLWPGRITSHRTVCLIGSVLYHESGLLTNLFYWQYTHMRERNCFVSSSFLWVVPIITSHSPKVLNVCKFSIGSGFTNLFD